MMTSSNPGPTRRVLGLLAVLGGLVVALAPGATTASSAAAQGTGVPDAGPVHVLRVDGEIDLGLAALTERAVAEAEAAGAAALVLRIDTPGGRLDAALRMRDVLLGAGVLTIAYVDRDAFSAGALIAIAAERLHLAPGGVLGAATPVLGDGQQADGKTVSAVRAVFRATALERGRDPAVAEAMVDADLVVEGLVRSGELLTLDVAQAQRVGYADGVDIDLTALLESVGLGDREVIEIRPALAERLVRILTSGIVAGLLLTVGIWLLVGDVLGGGGLGLGAALGSAAIATFLFGHMLAGLAGWESVVLVVLGLVLIVIEVFVLPGIGIAGVTGVLALLGGAVLAMVDREVEIVPSALITRAVSIAGISFLAAVALIAMVLALASRRGELERQGSRLVLKSDVGGAHEPTLLGARGVALTDLHPSGAVGVDGQRIDVVAEAGFIEAGTPVEIIIDEGYRRVVRAARAEGSDQQE
jgi:membrane-bound serine protease (ClpP class)